MTVYLAGAVVGACGRSCYQARSARRTCRCICDGLNHAAGLERAIANVRAHHAQWAARARAEGRIDLYGLPLQVAQHALF